MDNALFGELANDFFRLNREPNTQEQENRTVPKNPEYALQSPVYLALEKKIADFKKVRELGYYNENPKAYLQWVYLMLDTIKEENYNNRFIAQYTARYEIYDIQNNKKFGEWQAKEFRDREISVLHPNKIDELIISFDIPLYHFNNRWWNLQSQFPHQRQRRSWNPKIEAIINDDYDNRLKFEITAFLSKLPNEIVKIINLK
jgi:hypothetical protein